MELKHVTSFWDRNPYLLADGGVVEWLNVGYILYFKSNPNIFSTTPFDASVDLYVRVCLFTILFLQFILFYSSAAFTSTKYAFDSTQFALNHVYVAAADDDVNLCMARSTGTWKRHHPQSPQIKCLFRQHLPTKLIAVSM